MIDHHLIYDDAPMLHHIPKEMGPFWNSPQKWVWLSKPSNDSQGHQKQRVFKFYFLKLQTETLHWGTCCENDR